jgi:general secretion pathway protein C
VALIAVDQKPARAYRVGAPVDDRLVVQAVQGRTVSLGPRGEPAEVQLELPPLAQAATGTLPAGPGAAGGPGATPMPAPGQARPPAVAPPQQRPPPAANPLQEQEPPPEAQQDPPGIPR